MKLLDLFCGRWGWSKAFAQRGWDCVGVDLTTPPEIPAGCEFLQMDVLTITAEWIKEQGFDFICASSPCEQFSVHGMKHFHPNPPYPELGIRLFEHTRAICETSGAPYVMENVRAAQQFVGNAVHHCGPFYLWGSGVPALLHQGISKGMRIGGGAEALRIKRTLGKEALRQYRREHDVLWQSSKSEARKQYTAQFATIPPELSNCVADYAEAILSVQK